MKEANEKWTLNSLQKYGKEYLVGGVSSTFRTNPFTNLPMYLSKAEKAYIYDIAGKKYIDFFMGHGAALLGHNRTEIKNAIIQVLDKGFTAEFDTSLTIDLAKEIIDIIPCAEKVRFVNSGSEATLLAMRLARGFTDKEKIIRIDGHYHGVHDYVLSNNLAAKIDRNNSGDRPSKIVYFSYGIPKTIEKTLIIIPWNNIEIYEKVVKKYGSEIAGIIMTPIDYNNGCITTTSEYLSSVNEIAHKNNIIVIYDETLSGFRTGISCAQGYYGVTPDICCLGKALSNGVPLSVVAGKEEIMSKIMDKEFPVVSGGTYSGNLIGVTAALTSINIMKQKDFYPNFLGTANYFFKNLQQLIENLDIEAIVQYLGSGFFIYFGTREPVVDYRQFEKLDMEFTNKFFRSCIQEGLYFHTDLTVSAAHTKDDIDLTLEKIQMILKKIKS